MLTQQLTANPNDMSGKLVITAGSTALPELQSLAEELKLRENIETNGPVTVVIVQDPPPQG